MAIKLLLVFNSPGEPWDKTVGNAFSYDSGELNAGGTIFTGITSAFISDPETGELVEEKGVNSFLCPPGFTLAIGDETVQINDPWPPVEGNGGSDGD